MGVEADSVPPVDEAGAAAVAKGVRSPTAGMLQCPCCGYDNALELKDAEAKRGAVDEDERLDRRGLLALVVALQAVPLRRRQRRRRRRKPKRRKRLDSLLRQRQRRPRRRTTPTRCRPGGRRLLTTTATRTTTTRPRVRVRGMTRSRRPDLPSRLARNAPLSRPPRTAAPLWRPRRTGLATLRRPTRRSAWPAVQMS